MYRLEHFHQYVYGRSVTVHTDHKPLVTIAKKEIGKISGKLQLMLLKLMRYQLTVQYVPGKQMILADTLSRAFLKMSVQEDTEMNAVVHSLSRHLAVSPEKKELYRKRRSETTFYRSLYSTIVDGRSTFKMLLLEYWSYRQHISVNDDLIFLEDRLVVPVMRPEILRILHEGHLGEEKYKKNARSLLFWQGMSKQVELIVSACVVCRQLRRIEKN